MNQHTRITACIKALHLIPHPEGGYYAPVYRHDAMVTVPYHEDGTTRPLLSSIYYLLPSGQISRWHCLLSDEIWCYHDGSPLCLHMFRPDGRYEAVRVGPDVENGVYPQVTVPAGIVFGAEVETPDSYCLVSCFVSPGFDFADFAFVEADTLHQRFPSQRDVIDRLR